MHTRFMKTDKYGYVGFPGRTDILGHLQIERLESIRPIGKIWRTLFNSAEVAVLSAYL